MTDDGVLDPRSLLRSLAEQQTILSQQLTALLALQSETARAHRLLVERALSPPSPTARAETTEQASPPDAPIEAQPVVAEATEKPAPAEAPLPPGRRKLRSEQYLRAPAGRVARGVTRQQLERMQRLHETGEAAQLVLQFGAYRGTRLVEVAEHDPEYVHKLALTAHRPQVRAAARALVLALEWNERRRPMSRSSNR
jgi:hypothetical protein